MFFLISPGKVNETLPTGSDPGFEARIDIITGSSAVHVGLKNSQLQRPLVVLPQSLLYALALP